MAEAYENLAGRVEEIVYRNPDNGYTVLQLNTGEANGDGETVAGEMPPISEGEERRCFAGSGPCTLALAANLRRYR